MVSLFAREERNGERSEIARVGYAPEPDSEGGVEHGQDGGGDITRAETQSSLSEYVLRS